MLPRMLRLLSAWLIFAVLSTLLPPGPPLQAAAHAQSAPQRSDQDQQPTPPPLPPLLPQPATLPTSETARAVIDKAGAEEAAPSLDALPSSFIANTGQTDKRVRFLTHSLRGQVMFGTSSVTLVLPTLISATGTLTTSERLAPRIREHAALQLRFLGASGQTTVEGLNLQPQTVNYLTGNDPAQQHTNIQSFGSIVYRQLYPGIDLQYDGNDNQIKGTYTVAPGVDPSLIRWRYAGNTAVSIDGSGALQITLPRAKRMLKGLATPVLTEAAPKAWQVINGQQQMVEVRYQLNADRSIGFVLGNYDHAQPLIIDPTLVYIAYIGGTDYDTSRDIATDAAGNVYITGDTLSSDFQSTPGALDPSYGTNTDAFVVKLSSTGDLIYSTYVGGSGTDNAYGITVSSDGRAAIVGSTNSPNFPLENSYQSAQLNTDAFVIQLTPAGNQLTYGTYFGGKATDKGFAITHNADGQLYIAGLTSSQGNQNNYANFPVTTNAFQTLLNGDDAGGYVDAFIAIFDPSKSGLSTRRHASYFGGGKGDESYAIALDSQNNIIIAGKTNSLDSAHVTGTQVPFPAYQALQPLYNGGVDGFIAKFNPDLSGLLYSTFFGGSKDDDIRGMAIDVQDNLTIVGTTFSQNIPLVKPYSSAAPGLATRPFVASFLPDGSALRFSTYFGPTNSSTMTGDDIAVDSAGQWTIVGTVQNSIIPVVNPYQSQNAGGFDAYATTFSPDGQSLRFSTYFGTPASEGATGIVAGPGTRLSITGTTGSYNLTNAFVLVLDGPVAPDDQYRCNCSKVHYYTATPVDTRSGNFWTSVTDLAVQTPGPALTWQRTYNSQAITETASFLSPGWQHPYATRLILPSMPTGEPNTIIIFDGNGNRQRFTIKDNGTYDPWAGVYATLTHTGGLYTLTRRDQSQLVYNDTTGLLTQIRDAQGRLVLLEYVPGTAQISRIYDAQTPSRALTVHYTAGRIDQVSDGSRTVNYAYNGSGDLWTVSDVMNRPTTYQYTGHRLTAIINALGQTVESIAYDTSIWPIRVSSQSFLDGHQEQFSYAPTFTTVTTIGADGTQSVAKYYYALNNTLAGIEVNGQAVESSSFDESFSPGSVTDGNGKTTATTYTTNGLPTSVTNALNQTTGASYDSRNNLTSVTDALNITTRYRYDQYNNVISTTLGLGTGNTTGETTLYTYTYDLRYVGDSLLREQRTPDKVVTRYEYNAAGQVITTTVGINTALAQVTSYGYDAIGRLNRTTVGVGTPLQRSDVTIYNADNTVASMVQNYKDGVFNPLAPDEDLITSYGYDALGRQSWLRDPSGHYSVTQYNAKGYVAWSAQNFTQSGWNGGTVPALPPAFNVAKPEQNRMTSYGYDGLGRTTLITETGLLLGATNTPPAVGWTTVESRVTRTEYDALSRPITTTLNYKANDDPLYGEKIQTLSRYDGAGNLTASRDTDGRWTLYGYDALSRPVTTTLSYIDNDPVTGASDNDLMHVTKYDAVGRVLQEISNYSTGTFAATRPITDLITTYQYDTLGRVTKTIENAATGTSGTEYNRTTNTAYELGTGRLQGVQDPLGRWTSYRYDALGRVISTIQNCVTASNAADKINCAAPNATFPDRNVTSQVRYDALGRSYETVDPLGVVSHSSFDGVGRTTGQIQNYVLGAPTTPITNVTTLTAYDVLGRAIAVTDSTSATTRQAYNALGQTTVMTDALNRVTSFGYDGVGRQVWQRDAGGKLTVMEYDPFDHLITTIRNYQDRFHYASDPTDEDIATSQFTTPGGFVYAQGSTGGSTTRFERDSLDRLVRVVENENAVTCANAPCNVTTQYQYNRLGNRTAIIDPLNHIRRFGYDAAGRMRSATDALNNQTSYTYDLADRLTTVTDPRGASNNQTYAYDKLDRLTSVTATNLGTISQTYNARGERATLADATGTTSFQYDQLGRMKRVSAPQTGVVQYTYTARGQRESLMYPNGTAIGYSYLADGQLDLVTQGTTSLADYGYDAQGRLHDVMRSNGSSTTYGYDNLNRLTSNQTVRGGLTYAQFQYELSTTSLRKRVTETVGTLTRAVDYTYDGLQRLLTVDATSGGDYAYTYDLAGNRLSASQNGTLTQSFTYNAANQVNGWTYDNVGNLLSDGTHTTTYDALSRAITQDNATNAYNGDGTLVAQTASGVTTRYTQDLAAPLSQILSDGPNTYVYGLERVVGLGASDNTWYITDGLGSVRQTQSQLGAMLSNTTYDPWGQVESGTVTTFGFTGELQQGSNVYLRARWYNAANGAFSAFRWRSNESSGITPYSNHVYIYALGNPINFSDPTGKYAVDEDGNRILEQDNPCSRVNRPITGLKDGQLNVKEARFNVDEIALSQCVAPLIFKYAAIHAMPANGFNKDTFAALMAAIIQFENGNPTLNDWANRTFGPLINDVQPWGDHSTGIANIRPGSVVEIYNCEIPLTEDRILQADLSPTYFTKEQLKRAKPLAEAVAGRWPTFSDRLGSSDNWLFSDLLQSEEFSIEMLAINLKRGVLRAVSEGLKPSVLNLATWHNSGIQHPQGLIKEGKYGYGVGIATFFIDRAAHNIGISLPADLNRYNIVEGNPRLDEKQLVDKKALQG